MTPENTPSTIKVNAGTPGNLRVLSMAADKVWTVADVLAMAELSTEGYDVRVNGLPAESTTIVSDNQTILLLAPVRGNNTMASVDGSPVFGAVGESAAVPAKPVKVNVGTPGNLRALELDGSKTWTVAEVLGAAELSTEGYDMRVNGLPADGSATITNGQTLLLLAPVRGN